MAEKSIDRVKASGFLSGAGEMHTLIRSRDWSDSALGEPEQWPNSLKTVVRIMFDTRYAIWIGWGPDLTFVYNDAYREMTLGKKHPWALGRPAREVWPEAWKDLSSRINEVLQHGRATYDENLLLLLERSGYSEETYHTFSYSPLLDDEGQVGGLLCIVVEGTDRYIAERRLKVLREVAAQIANTRTPEDLFSAISRCVGANPHDVPFSLIYLTEPDGRQARLVCHTGIDTAHPAASAMVETNGVNGPWPIGQVLSRSETTVVDDLSTRFPDLPSGAWGVAPRNAVVVPISQPGQAQPAGVMIIGLNPFRLFDDVYRGFIDLLAGQIAAGLADVRAYEEERKRAEALAEIDRAKTVFFSNASHEFRTPLTLMLSPLQDLIARNSGPESVNVKREELELIHRNGLRLLRLVNTLLDFSRIEAGRMEAVYESVDLAAYTAELASSFRSAMDQAGLRYSVDCAPMQQAVYIDRDMWEKIVLNLISNAFKYTLEGEVAVSVCLSSDQRNALLIVRDTGTGIPAHELPRVFERFHRIEGQIGRTHEGTGIGLALVQELVRLHGGNVHVESMIGKGSTFTVSIPLGTAHLAAERIGGQQTLAPTDLRAQAFVEEALRWLPGAARAELTAKQELTAPRVSSASAREQRVVLVADDNADMRDYIRRLLSIRYHVEAAADGLAALELARRRPPDLILTDVMMPRMDGFALVREVRSDPELRDVPVILLTARAGEEDSVEGLEAGADDYLAKPFSARELLARVAANLDLAQSRRETANILREETHRLRILNRTGAALAAELDLERLVQAMTDAAVELTHAQFGAFFYNVAANDEGSYRLSSLSGAPREAFSGFPMPRNTMLFETTFRGAGVLRSDDVQKDSRYGKHPPYYGIPEGHLPIHSYLAVPVVSRSAQVHGGLFLGHAQPGVFTERHELIVTGIAAQAAIAIDNARLYSASRKAEEDLRRLNETLEQRVAAEIAVRMKTEEAFRQVQKMEAIGQLTGGVAHDFNNLLQVITGNLYLLQQRLSTGKVSATEFRRWTDGALRGAQRGGLLTQRLLAFSRRQPLNSKTLDVNRLVAGMSELLRRTLGESIGIETVLAGGLWRTFADANELENALLNLAVNARDAMREGGRLTIETANTYIDDAYAAAHDDVPSGQYVMIAVSDTGTGMTADVIARAFEPFFTTKEIGQGTGLGLSQVYGFVKQSGGHVKIYSEPGEGTTVKIYMPRLMDGNTEIPIEGAAPQPPVGAQGEIILLVEDDEDVRANTTMMLRELGYGVLEAVDGPTAVELLKSKAGIDLLFTDVGLPGGMNGRQLADQARLLRPGLNVLFTSGYARNAIAHQGRLDPGVELLSKPFTLNQLAAKMRQMFKGAPSARTI